MLDNVGNVSNGVYLFKLLFNKSNLGKKYCKPPSLKFYFILM